MDKTWLTLQNLNFKQFVYVSLMNNFVNTAKYNLVAFNITNKNDQSFKANETQLGW